MNSTDPRLLFLPSMVLIMLMLIGCSTTKEDVIPQNGPDMQKIYADAMRRSDIQRTRRRIGPGNRDLRGYTRRAADDITQVFPRLPNPQMVLYVYPHLSAEGAPVPAYTTVFPMYAVDQYALPGEVYHP